MRKAVYIKWIDSAGPGASSWRAYPTAGFTPLVIHSIGFVHEESKKHITIGLSYDAQEEPNVDYFLAIPKVAILKRKAIKL